MGKKSKRSKPKAGQKGGGAAPAPAAAAADVTAAGAAGSGAPAPQPPTHQPPAHQPPTPPPCAACWICLDGDPDEGGKPIVRNCSCRGDDAGFAHISCLVKYAEGKTEEIREANVSGRQPRQKPHEPWTICPNCRREYQGQVALAMNKSLLSYIDDNFPPDMVTAKLGALTIIVKTVISMPRRERNPGVREEGKRAATQMLEVIQRSGHTEDEEFEEFINQQRVYAYVALGKFGEEEKTREGYEMALEYFGKARDFYKSGGQHEIARGLETTMDGVKSMRDGRETPRLSKEDLKFIRVSYAEDVEKWGVESTEALRNGSTLVTALSALGTHRLECERLAAKLLGISRRVHGPDHDLTVRIESGLRKSRVRRLVKVVAASVVHRVLEVNEEEQKYIVRSSAPQEGLVSEVAFDEDYMIVPGTPVVG